MQVESAPQNAEPDDQLPRAKRGLRIFCSVAFLFFMGSFSHLFGSDEGDGAGPLKSLFLPLALVIQIVAIALLAAPSRWRESLRILARNWMMIIALGVIVASAMWSIDSSVTLRRSAALLGTTAVGLLIYVALPRKEVLRFLSANLAIFVAASALFAVFVPALGTHGAGKFEGDWRGLLTFKNQAAWAAVIFVLLWMGVRKSQWMRTWRVPLLAVGILFVLKSGSATGIAALVFGACVLMLLNIYRRYQAVRPFVIAAIGIVLTFVVSNIESLMTWGLDELGRDATLSGRTSVWSALSPIIEQHYWLGSGYLAFWADSSAYFGSFGSTSWMTDIGHAHNAYLEILLDVGMIGLITQVAFLAITSWRLFALSGRGDGDAAVMLAVLLTLAVVGIAGALFFRPNTGTWIIVVVFACYASDMPRTSVSGDSRHKLGSVHG